MTMLLRFFFFKLKEKLRPCSTVGFQTSVIQTNLSVVRAFVLAHGSEFRFESRTEIESAFL